ncbi:phosphopantothenoylcysteine decarboxylase [Thiohalorhabdus denitrificans]|uniref:Coenzyme A biosynthesis bifunctional protein CoaBC n=1 Tax=Thiohalorhabdus denitrificans TaxID=381306 RepID=A0A0P9GLG8_9GAMM|nr:bifunctional phosphopantothenoylcysteine decarboxylase/phosphopantothenate--cysteine ligase CoaBC [Thiohalorhabdus denitrificans]KPV40991.1 phosphopantothenoylcysteine decarboxylase [Thiohalorhabdus denitrificans]SCY42463.1 Phosphopantothenate-cysteine ligase [Thiohalorhabdus denitrificans]
MSQPPENPGTDPLAGARVLLAVTGSIAAYKAPELVRRLREAGAEVRVVLSEGGAHFVTPMALQAVSGAPVRTALLDPAEESAMDHIALARWADALLVAPASADTLARLVQGRADDLLGAVHLATTAPVLAAPAMNHRMWAHPATRRNAEQLEADGVTLLGPAAGDQACGEEGPGRMLEPAELVAHLRIRLAVKPLAGKRVVITAGPTREPLDPVRFVSNRSSGKMGYALAATAAELGAAVTLVSGPTALPDPVAVDTVRVETAEEMLDAVQERAADADLFVGCAAVSDHKPAERLDRKRKGKGGFALELTPNPDILAAVAALDNGPVTLGFAAETHDALAHGREKRAAKGADWLAVNDVTEADAGFEADTNRVTLLGPDGEETLPFGTKHEVARALLARIAPRLA